MLRVPKKFLKKTKEGCRGKRFSKSPAFQPLRTNSSLLNDTEELPKISVITPSYNQSKFLRICIESVLGQKYPKLEYLIFDGGSTDQSVDIIMQYEDMLTFWVSEPDEGQSQAINKGFERSTGDLVAWLNSDDFYLPGALTTVGKAYQKNPDASFYFGDGWRVDHAGQPKGPFFPVNHLIFDRTSLILGLNYILQPSTFINRVHLTNAGYLDSSLRYGMDSDLWIRLSQMAPPEPVFAFLAATREYEHTKTATGSFDRVEELRRIAEKYSGLPLTPGVLCYFLDTLHHLVGEREDIFTKDFKKKVEIFWAEASGLMARFGSRPDGFPICKK